MKNKTNGSPSKSCMEINLIRDLPMVERPRERLARVGAEGLKAEELLAIVLRTGDMGL